MNEQIVAYLREHPDGVTSSELAERFLKFKSPDERLAHVAVMGILKSDARCVYGSDGQWTASAAADKQDRPLYDLPWTAVSVLADGRRLLHVSAWSVLPEPSSLASHWLVDPASLSPEDRQALVAPTDKPFDTAQTDDILTSLASGLGERTGVYVSSRNESLVSWHCSNAGATPGDDTVLLSSLFRSLGMPVPRPLTLPAAYESLLGRQPYVVPAGQRGRLLAECVYELLLRLRQQGVETREQLERRLAREVEAFDFAGKHFSQETLADLTTGPGVYGFKDSSQTFIYIGKAANVRRRVGGYFRKTDESPAKLDQLRSDAVELIVYPCGSELESLLYEHRLINKYTPRLNTQAEIRERKGSFRAIDDCVVLLPHAEREKGMSVWFRRNQKIMLRPFAADCSDMADMAEDLEGFFFADRLQPEETDFPEQEIAHRWIRRQGDTLTVVPVFRMGSGQEVASAMTVAWQNSAMAPNP